MIELAHRDSAGGSSLNDVVNMQVQDLGRMAYGQALAVQRSVHERVRGGQSGPTLLLVEHDPVITISRRKSAAGNLLASAQRLAELGIDVAETDRGGDITYHGPGQLVAYPILPLAPLKLMVGSYMRLLEQVVIDTVAAFALEAHRIDKCTGVWTDTASGPAKLCALGIRVQRNVTLHGLALNVTTNLSHFDTIVPCGIRDRGVTSLAQLLGAKCPSMARVKAELVRQFDAHLRGKPRRFVDTAGVSASRPSRCR